MVHSLTVFLDELTSVSSQVESIGIRLHRLVNLFNSGGGLTVWTFARFVGWKNTVKKVTVRYAVE